VNARPLVLCNPNRHVADAPDGTPVFVDASCFARPLVRGEIGNASRNMIRRPGVINSDLAFFKNVRLREKLRLQFRWETYNLFNHTNFNDIDTDLTLYAQHDDQCGHADQRAVRPADYGALAARDAGSLDGFQLF
jgi:hypothetical protein